MKVRLSINHKKANVKSVVLNSDAVIGRSTECNLRLASGQISRKHCKLIVDGDTVAIVALGSSNGSYLNGQRLTKLTSGDELSIGSIDFLIEYKDPAAETAIHGSQDKSDAQIGVSATNEGPSTAENSGAPQPPEESGDQSGIDLDEISDDELESLLADEGFEEDDEQVSIELEPGDAEENDAIGAAAETINIPVGTQQIPQEEFSTEEDGEEDDDQESAEDDEDDGNIKNFLQDLEE